jgi:hypothetical protein
MLLVSSIAFPAASLLLLLPFHSRRTFIVHRAYLLALAVGQSNTHDSTLSYRIDHEEPSRSEVNDDDDYVESDDDYVGNDQFDDDMELDSYIEAYPESKLVYLQSKTSRSKKVKNEINNLKHMKSVDDEFKMRLYLEEDLQRLYL